MSKGKMRECKSCGKEISAKGKVTCPECGAVNKKAIYKRAWFIILAFLVIIAVMNVGGDDEPNLADATSNGQNEEEIEVIEVNIGELYDELENNALKASKTYKGKYIKTTGILSVIDSSGDYFTLDPLSGSGLFRSLHCSIDEKHVDKLMEFNTGYKITVIGKVDTIGEIAGYMMDVEVIE